MTESFRPFGTEVKLWLDKALEMLEPDKDARTGEPAEGLAKGRAEMLNEKLSTARKMKADGLSVEAICKYTGLSPEQVEGLA